MGSRSKKLLISIKNPGWSTFVLFIGTNPCRYHKAYHYNQSRDLEQDVLKDRRNACWSNYILFIERKPCMQHKACHDNQSWMVSIYGWCGSIPLSTVIVRERLRWLGHVLQMKDDRLPKIVLFGQPSGATRKAGRPCLSWEDVINKDLKEMGTSWEGVKREALNRWGWRRSLRSCVGLRRLEAAVSY